MKCNSCGRDNPEYAKHCMFCGGALTAEPQFTENTAPVGAQGGPEIPEKKSRPLAGILVKVIGIAVAVLVGSGFFGLFAGGALPEIEDDGIVSPEYQQVFESRGLAVPESDICNQDEKAAAYVTVLEDGMLELLEYGYVKGQVVTMVDTLYVPVEDYDDATRSLLNANVQESLAIYKEAGFCTVTSTLGDSYYIYKIVFNDLTDSAHLQKMAEWDMVTSEKPGEKVEIISMQFSEESLLAQGYVKR